MVLQTLIDNLSDTTENLVSTLQDQGYDWEDMMSFIEDKGQENFVNYYENYVTLVVQHSYDAVEAFIEEFGIDCLSGFEDSYYGEYTDEEQFAEEFFYNLNYNIPDFVIVDWEKTWEQNLSDDFAFSGGYIFCKNF